MMLEKIINNEVKMKILFFKVLLFAIQVFPQEEALRTIDEKKGNTMLIGKCTKEDFQDTAFASWFNEEYEYYSPNINIIASDLFLDRVDKIIIVMGTWCSDSHREVPRFIKLMECINYPENQIEIIAVDRQKNAPGFDKELFDIKFVPTFIFYQGEEELGRIIESPQISLEEDINEILSK